MSQLLGLLSPLGFRSGENQKVDSDFVDRLSHSYSVLILLVFAIVVSTKQYVGDPIEVSFHVKLITCSLTLGLKCLKKNRYVFNMGCFL